MGSSTTSPEDILQQLIEGSKKLGADGVDARLVESASLSVEVRNGALETVEREESIGVALRAFSGQRQAHVSGTDLSADGLDALCERVVAMAKLAPEDPYCGLTDAEDLADELIELDLGCDERPSAKDLEARALAAEEAALGVKGVKQTSYAGAGWGESQRWVAASNGFAANRKSGSMSIGVEAIADRDGDMERDYEGRSARKKADLWAPDVIGRRAGEMAVERLGPRKADSGTTTVIFENRLSARLLGAFVGAVSGPAIARGVSFLKDKVGEQVFASGVSVTDDPLKRGGFGSRSHDGEGRPVSRTALVEDGVLSQWLLNGPSAKQLGLKPNGFASLSFGDPPGVATSNLQIDPGEKDLAALMVEAGQGLLITDMFGPSLNPNTGDYSVGVSGFWFENGEKAYPVSEVTVAGDLPSMFKRMVVGSDLEIRGSTNAPSLMFDGMALAGK